jgi:PAS domain S-box-containing protein
VEFIAIAVLYFALAKGSLVFASINPSATPVWPPTGLALGAVLLFGPRILPAVFLAAFAANVITAGTVATSIAIAAGNALEALVGALLMNRWAQGRDAFETPLGIAKFAIIVLGAATPVSATIGVGALSLAGFAAWADFPAIWITWWLGDVAGGLMVAPAVVLWANWLRAAEPESAGRLELCLLLLCAAAVGAVALGPVFEPSSGRNALTFLAVVPLFWAALRRGQRDTATVALILSAFAVWGVAAGTGPFVQLTLNASLLLLVSFIAAITLPSLALGASVISHEEARQQSEEDYHRLVESVRDYAIFRLDPTGRIETWNTGAARIKGYTQEEIVGRHFSCFYSEEDRRRGVPDRALAAAAERGRFEGEGWRIRKDGSRFWASVVISAIHDDDGALIGFAKVTRDQTEAHEAQKTLEQTREMLHQAQKLEALGQLTGGVAHDFNNLLMAISGGVSLLARAKPEMRDKVLEEMQNAVERGAGLTRQLLAFARRETLRPVPVDIGERFAAMQELLRRSLGPSIRLELSFPSGLWPIHVDPSQLELSILNLVINARDAMQDGGTLTIAAENAPTVAATLSEPDFVRLSVRDTGAGMSPEVRARAFEPFYSTKGPGLGTGLGLSQVHGFAEQSGGSARIESAPGLGTTVILSLPRATKAMQALPEAAIAPAGTAEAGSILMVEDDDQVALVVQAMIEDLGYRVTRVGDALQALDLLDRGETFDLVFSDVVMPGELNGLQLAAVIRERRPGMQIVLTTGYAGVAESRTADYQVVPKPYTMAALDEAFRTALSQAPQDA